MPTTPSSNTLSRSPSATPDRDLQISAHSTLETPFDCSDRRYFEHFRQKCVYDLVGLVDTDLWNYYVLQISASKPAIQYAILALSAQHKAFLARGLSKGDQCSSDGESCAIYSWTQYSKATRILQRQLTNSPNTAATLEETLIICLLFIAFEVLQGNYLAALTHLEGGLEIISSREPLAIHGEDLSTSSLAKVFKRLDIQASSYVGVRNVKPFSFSNASSHSSISGLPNQNIMVFNDVRDAFDSLNLHVASIYHFMRSPTPSLSHHPQLSSKSVMDLRYEPLLHLAAGHDSNFGGLYEEQAEKLDALGNWALAFEAFLIKLSSKASHHETSKAEFRKAKDSRQCAVLWISYLIILNTLSTCLEPDESSYDKYMPGFQSIVEHAEYILLPQARDDPNSARGARFSFEMAVIQPLYFTALKCRNHNLRHQAISLLHISGQEGVWDGKMLAVIAKHIVEHEECQRNVEALSEQALVSKLPSESDNESLVIPEAARVHGVTLGIIDRINRKVRIEYTKRIFNIERKSHAKSGLQAYEWILLQKSLEW